MKTSLRLPTSKVVVLALFYKKQVQTDATTSWTYIDIDLPEATEAGPWLESLTAHTLLENPTAIEYKLVFYYSADGRTWKGPYDIHSPVTSADHYVHPAYTTTTNFGLQMRYAIAVRNSSATGKVERAVVTAALALMFWS